MFTKIKSFGLNGLDGYLVDVEVDISNGLPTYDIAGLADTAIKESKFRVKGAIKNSEFQFPIDKVTVNLAPADTKKEGSLYDLAIAIGILTCQGVVDRAKTNNFAYVGELSLDGTIKKVNGILPILITARDLGITKVVIPKENAYESFLLASAAMVDKKVPINDRVVFVTPLYYTYLKLDKRFTSYGDKAQEIATNGAVGKIDNTEVVVAPTDYFPEGVNYIIIYKTALLSPLKLSEYLQHENPPGLSGWLCEGRIYFDAFVLKNKKDGIFVSFNSSYVADEAVTGE